MAEFYRACWAARVAVASRTKSNFSLRVDDLSAEIRNVSA